MKTITLTFLLISLAFAGCVSQPGESIDEPVDDPQSSIPEEPVSPVPGTARFTVHNGTVASVDIELNQDNATIFLNDEPVESTGRNASISFPETEVGTYSKQIRIEFEVGDDIDEQVDYVVNGKRPSWFDEEPTDEHVIRPGVNVGGCTGAFLMHDNYERFFISLASHCIATGHPYGDPQEDYCGYEKPQPLGYELNVIPMHDTSLLFSERITKVSLAYHGWGTITPVREQYELECKGHDFALMEIQPKDWHIMHPKGHGIIGHVTGVKDCADYGGDVNSQPSLEPVKAYGRSDSRNYVTVTQNDDVDPINDHHGVLYAPMFNGTMCAVQFLPTMIPGDSGSPMSNMNGEAMGILSSIAFVPHPGINYSVNVPVNLELMEELVGWAPEVVLSA